MNSAKLIVAFIATLLLQACTVANYQVINKVSETPPRKVSEPCNIKYSLSLTSSSHFRTNTQGVRYLSADEDVVRDLKNKYIASTKEALSKKGCIAAYVESAEDADLRIQVGRTVDLGDRGAVLIEGLTLGLIPNWGTREGQFVFTFYNTKAKTTHSYIVDENYYSHLFLLPVFPASTLDEFKPYQESLIDFVENCNAECQPKKNYKIELPTGKSLNTPQVDGVPPSYKIEPPTGKVSLILLYPSELGARDLTVKVNGSPIAELPNGSFTVVYVEPGKVEIEGEIHCHLCLAKNGVVANDMQTAEATINEEISAVWLLQKGGFQGIYQWMIVPRSSAGSYLKKYTYIPPNKNP